MCVQEIWTASSAAAAAAAAAAPAAEIKKLESA